MDRVWEESQCSGIGWKGGKKGKRREPGTGRGREEERQRGAEVDLQTSAKYLFRHGKCFRWKFQSGQMP